MINGKPARALADTGTIGGTPLSNRYITTNNIPYKPRKNPVNLKMAGKGSWSTSNYTAIVDVEIGKMNVRNVEMMITLEGSVLSCGRCGRGNHEWKNQCMRPTITVPKTYEFCITQKALCIHCDRDVSAPAAHFVGFPDCLDKWRDAFYRDIQNWWDDVDRVMLEWLAIWRFGNDDARREGGRWRCRCGHVHEKKEQLVRHVKSPGGDGCFDGLWDEFVLWVLETYG